MKNISAVPLIGRQRNVSENLFVLGSGSAKRKGFPTLELELSGQEAIPSHSVPLLHQPDIGRRSSFEVCITTSCTYLS